MIYLFLFLLVFVTIIFLGVKDPGVRITKYFTLMFVMLFSMHLWHIDFKSLYSAFFIGLFLVDEWLSLIPKIDKWNKMKRVSVADIELVEFSAINEIPKDYIFEMAANIHGNVVEKTPNFMKIVFWIKGALVTTKYIKDFESDFKVLSGNFIVSTYDIYENETKHHLNKGDRFQINAYVPHSFEAFDDKVKIETIAKKHEQ